MSETIQSSGDRRALLEKYLRSNRSLSTTSGKNIIPRRPRGGSFPLSVGQQGLYFLSQLTPDVPVYNECVTLHLGGSLDIAIFEQSFNEILRRHEEWRTCFPLEGGQPVQRICAYQPLSLPAVDLMHLPEAEREMEALRIAAEHAEQPFDFTHGPLLRTLLVRLSDRDTRLFLTMHHLIFDGFSLYQILLPELRAIYEAFLDGRPSPLPELPIQYADFAVWQQEALHEERFSAHMEYWKRQLADAPTVLDLPTDRPRPLVPTSRGAMYPFALSRDLLDALKDLSLQENVTLFMTMVAAFQTLLRRYCGQEDILLGTPISDRRRPEVQKLLGFFLNTVALRINSPGDPSFRDLLKQVRKVFLEAQEHQDVPFEYLVKELQPERAPGQNPFFQVMITIEPPLPALASGWTLTPMDVQADAAKFDLYLEIDERPEGLIGRFRYSSDLFDATTIARMFEHWQTLLEGIVAYPERHLSELPLLTEAEKQLLLVEWNNTAKEYPKEKCVHHLFEEQVARTPDAVAAIFEQERLTYQELNRRANQLAHYLQQRGVGPDILVGVCMERSLEMVVSLLAILKAGGAYVPLDPTYPHERLLFMLQDAQVSVLLTQERFKAELKQHAAQVICVDAEWATLGEQPGGNPGGNPISEVEPHHLAYMIYTSGSTGKPKGAMNTHRGICNRLLSMQDTYQLQPGEAVLQKTPFGFDVSVWEFFWPLLVGARLVVARPDGHRDSTYLIQLIVEQQITTVHFVPSMLRVFLEHHDVETCSSLKRVTCGGEALSFELQQRFFERLGAELHNFYGPAEAAVDVTSWACKRGSTLRFVPIGRPIANTDLYVLDAYLNPVPIGVAGELYIGGTGLGRGYFNRPELTAERFIPHPFSSQPGARLYKTGDRVRYLVDGNIEYLGRLDYQTKIRGVRIELGEIEAVLEQHPAVREAVVVAQDDGSGDKYLVAYVSLHKNETTTISDLHNHLKMHLLANMIPSAFMLLPALPLLPSGKVDRQALPKPDANTTLKEGDFVAPNSTTQYRLVQIWEELLNVHPIGIKDNFFYLGGHSLLAARLMDKIEQSFGKKISPATLFVGPTIEHLTDVLQAESNSSRVPLVGIQTNGSKQPFFYLPGTWNSGASYCFSIARQLGPDQPFYILEPSYSDGPPQVPPTYESMATAQLEAIRTVQPQGPYRLGGFCNGGLGAYEMARQLLAQGEQVDLLVMIDPASPPSSHKLIRRLITRVGNVLGTSQTWQAEWFLRLRHVYKHILRQRNAKTLEEFTAVDPSIYTLFPTAEAIWKDNIAISNWITAGYGYDSYPGKATVLLAAAESLGPAWQQKVAKEKGIEVRVIPGTHISCRTDHVLALAEELKRCLS
jgi:amino acid adenylation domain-containing protein